VPVQFGSMVFLSLQEVRDRFPKERRPSMETLRRYIRARQLAGRKVGVGWYCSEHALEVFLAGAGLANEKTDAPEAQTARGAAKR